MKKLSLVILSVLLIILLANCQPLPDANNLTGLLSEVSYGTNKAYIIGSMHLGKKDAFRINDVIKKCMSESDTFVFEYDISDTLTMELFTAGFLIPDGKTLKEYLPQDIFENYVRNVETYSNGIGYDTYKNFLPAKIEALYIIPYLYEKANLSAENGMELLFYRYAVQNRKVIKGLNSVESELSMAYGMPKDVQIAIATDYASLTPDEMSNRSTLSWNAMAEAYQNTDVTGLKKIFYDEIDASTEPYKQYWLDVLIDERNTIQADAIEDLLKEGDGNTYFIICGIGHLLSETENVFTLLEDKGFEVTPVFTEEGR